MNLFSSSPTTQVSSSNNNNINLNPIFNVGSSGGSFLPDNTSSFSNPITQSPYYKDEQSMTTTLDAQAKANFAGGEVKDYGNVEKASGYAIGSGADDVLPNTVPTFTGISAVAGSISPVWLWLGGFVLLVLLFKKR